MGEGPCLIILKAIREKIGKQVDDFVTVTVEHDTTPRKIELPNEVKSLLNKNKTQKDFFNSLSFTNQKEYVKWITDAKREETRLARLQSMLDKLKTKMKNPTMQ